MRAPAIPVRALTGPSSAFSDRKLDEGIGLTSASGADCDRCGGELAFDTDHIGRSTETCRSCGYTPPSKSRTSPAIGAENGADYNDYTARGPNAIKRRPPVLLPSEDPAVLAIRTLRAERAASPSPLLLEAKREFDELLAREKEARKPGRPKNFSVGRPPPRATRGQVVITDLEDAPPAPAPRRPPLAVASPTTESTMPPTIETRRATECGHDTPKRAGPPPKLCDSCKGSDRPPKQATRKHANTGFKARPRSSNGGGYSSVLDDLREKLDALDARREKLVAAMESIRNLDGATE